MIGYIPSFMKISQPILDIFEHGGHVEHVTQDVEHVTQDFANKLRFPLFMEATHKISGFKSRSLKSIYMLTPPSSL